MSGPAGEQPSSWAGLGPAAIAAILLLAAAVKVTLAVLVPMTADECLHWLQGKHLAWGFTDHPPGTAASSRLATAILGDTALGARLVPIIGLLACSAIAYAMLREVGADRRRAATAAAFTQLLPMIGIGALMVPAIPHAPLVLAAEYALLRALRRGSSTDHVAAGALLGAAAMTYYLAAFAALAAAVFFVLDPRGRRALRTPGPWLGAAVAAAVCAPNALWNLGQGDRNALQFQLVGRREVDFSPHYLAAFLVLAVVLAGPLLLSACARALRVARSGSAASDDWRPLFASFLLVPLALCAAAGTVTRVGAHWAVIAYLNVPLLLFAPHAEPLTRGWRRSALLVGGALAALTFGLAAVGIERAAAVLDRLVQPQADRDRFLHAGDAAVAAQDLAAAMAADGRPVRLACDRWSLASLLSFRGGGTGRYAVYPPPRRHGRDFPGWFGGDGEPVELVYVSTTPEVPDTVRAASRSVRRVEVFGGSVEFLWIHHCSGFLAPADWQGHDR